MVAPDKPNNALIATFVVTCCGVVIAMVIGIIQLFTLAAKEELQETVLSQGRTQFNQQRAVEEGKLRGNQWVDKDKGVVRINVERAAELTVQQYRANAPASGGATP